MFGRFMRGIRFGLGRGWRMGMGGMRQPRNCVCPKCGYFQEHVPGTPCHQVMCPSCGRPMRGEIR